MEEKTERKEEREKIASQVQRSISRRKKRGNVVRHAGKMVRVQQRLH